MDIVFRSDHASRQFPGGRHCVRIEIVDGSDVRFDEIYFTVPQGFFVHDDSMAACLSTLCGKVYERIRFAFPISERCRGAIARRTKAAIGSDGTADERSTGSNIGLNFSGGFELACCFASHAEGEHEDDSCRFSR